jgi:hypothetical protein
MDETDGDQRQAAREADARRRLLARGAADLPRAPWLRGRQPAAAGDLVRFTLWRAGADAVDEEDVLAALTLLPAARAEVDQMEAALLLTARARGLSWARVSRAIGLGSAQAAQQRFDRVSGRVGDRPDPGAKDGR